MIIQNIGYIRSVVVFYPTSHLIIVIATINSVSIRRLNKKVQPPWNTISPHQPTTTTAVRPRCTEIGTVAIWSQATLAALLGCTTAALPDGEFMGLRGIPSATSLILPLEVGIYTDWHSKI